MASEGAAGRADDDDEVPSMPGVGVLVGLDELLDGLKQTAWSCGQQVHRLRLRHALATPSPLRPRSRVATSVERPFLSPADDTSGECTPESEVRPF